MKKIVGTLAVVAFGTVISFGQDLKPGASGGSQPGMQIVPVQQNITAEKAAERKTHMYDMQLGLSEKQHMEIYQVELAAEQRERAMQQRGVQPSPQEQMQMNAGKDQKFKTILTPEQYARYDVARPKMQSSPATK